MDKIPLIYVGGPSVISPRTGDVSSLAGGATIRLDPAEYSPTGHPGEIQYLGLLQELVDKHEANPIARDDRTGVGTYSVFGRQMRFQLGDSFPLLTTKKVFWKGVVAELLWMLSGDTNAKTLQEQNVHIWDEWCDENCSLGPVYGKQWRDWNGIDQISKVIKDLNDKPNDRGHIVSAWNVEDIPKMGLRPCHTLFQFYVEDGRLSCQLYQRSADIFLGVPFNIASYALLTHIIARETGLEVGEFIHTFGDLHLYSNHVEQAKEQLSRAPRPFPTVEILGDKDIFDLTLEDFQLEGYDPHPAIKAEVAV